MSKHKPLHEQVMVITGASSGIGLCIAILASALGATVVLVARSEETLEQLTSEINASGGEAFCVAADVSERSEVDKVVDQVLAHYGRIDTWVNDAGVSIYGRLDEVGEEDSRRLFDINFWGVVNGSLAALPHLRHSGGVLINVGSEVSESMVPLQGIYTASKHAVKGFTDALRVEIEDVDESAVSITLIQPTAVDTPYPEHAKNYMTREPKLPEPMIDPQLVAEAILQAAQEGGRNIKVGMMATLNTSLNKFIPALAEKLSARLVDKQQQGRPPQNPQGTLYHAGGNGRIHGTVRH
ncbi:SDR family NAD(P)-dependent oxidoreductase [Methylobacillus caricis]|uniref:SDR family oxidoreductase n=1 Tax=Methylobacillus caricis TaxID=1971611 RepID=UPI001CFF7612|nr:SDR family oxidoreductase [Methylobacillus caricis]MCB5188299.1 SDR family NAD(P)-dependent oxidoreductase [Methylobacillus caricis]